MEVESTRRSACDRCRGQKLRCVRLPGLNKEQSPRSARPASQPCERCKRAKVVCYTTKPVPRRLPQDYSQRRSTLYDDDDFIQSEVDLDEAMVGVSETRGDLTTGRTARSSADRLTHDPFSAELWPGFGISHASLGSLPAFTQLSDASNNFENTATHRGNNNTLPPSSTQRGWPDHVNYLPRSVHDMPDAMNVPSPDDISSALDIASHGPAAATSRTSHVFQSDTRVIDPSSRHELASSLESPQGSVKNLQSQVYRPLRTNGRGLSSSTSNSMPDNAQLCTSQLSELNVRLRKGIENTTSFRQRLSAVSNLCHPNFGLGGNTPSSSSVISEFTDNMLGNCQNFLDILQRLKLSTMELRERISSESSCGDLEYISKDYSSSQSQSRNHSTSTSSRSRDGRMATGGGPSNVRGNGDITGLSSSLDVAKADSSDLDFSVFLSILSCYTHILQAYDALFTEILDMLTESPCIQLDLKIPNLVPEVSLGGFRLDGHGDLQMKCLLHMSFIILEKIENMLGVNASAKDTYGSNGGLLNNSQLRGLLEALYHQKEFDYIKADGTWTARVKKTMKSIQRILDTI